ncbi:hypothetical protein [Aeoliella sp.]|uniref:hypothetical protein n=1 Tax=Aeoliella sp. TaxID=2795800 RepID=UPI003CCB808E
MKQKTDQSGHAANGRKYRSLVALPKRQLTIWLWIVVPHLRSQAATVDSGNNVALYFIGSGEINSQLAAYQIKRESVLVAQQRNQFTLDEGNFLGTVHAVYA